MLGRGRVQEEIRFTVCPELLVSLLFMEAMEENEAIIISGFEQFSTTCGYAASLEFAGDHRDPAQVTNSISFNSISVCLTCFCGCRDIDSRSFGCVII